MNIATITDHHCGAGIFTIDHAGSLTPKFWAQSATTRVIAQPSHQRGMEIMMSHGVLMMALMAQMCEGRWIGRTVEAWTRTFTDGEKYPAGGLASIAETDPTVHTGVVAQGFDLYSGETHTTLASFSLDHNAQPLWTRRHDTNHGDQFLGFAMSVQHYLAQPRESFEQADVDEFFDYCGWCYEVHGA